VTEDEDKAEDEPAEESENERPATTEEKLEVKRRLRYIYDLDNDAGKKVKAYINKLDMKQIAKPALDKLIHQLDMKIDEVGGNSDRIPTLQELEGKEVPEQTAPDEGVVDEDGDVLPENIAKGSNKTIKSPKGLGDDA
jgi:hypothetical protein